MTSRPPNRTTPCTREQAGQRLRQAEAFLGWARAALADEGDEANLGVATSLAILAGVAATDALCGSSLGYYSRGQNHAEAANLVRSIEPGGPALASTFRQLLARKEDTSQAPKSLLESSAKAALRQAGDLVSAARTNP
jgi:hypothetical protein